MAGDDGIDCNTSLKFSDSYTASPPNQMIKITKVIDRSESQLIRDNDRNRAQAIPRLRRGPRAAAKHPTLTLPHPARGPVRKPTA